MPDADHRCEIDSVAIRMSTNLSPVSYADRSQLWGEAAVHSLTSAHSGRPVIDGHTIKNSRRNSPRKPARKHTHQNQDRTYDDPQTRSQTNRRQEVANQSRHRTGKIPQRTAQTP